MGQDREYGLDMLRFVWIGVLEKEVHIGVQFASWKLRGEVWPRCDFGDSSVAGAL